MHRSRLCHIVIDCNDLERAISFWSAALGATAEPVNPASAHIYGRLKLPEDEIRVLLQLVPEAKLCKARVHLDIESDDVEAECRRLEALGGTRDHEQNERGYHFWVLLDPSGNEFCVIETEFPELLRHAKERGDDS